MNVNTMENNKLLVFPLRARGKRRRQIWRSRVVIPDYFEFSALVTNDSRVSASASSDEKRTLLQFVLVLQLIIWSLVHTAVGLYNQKKKQKKTI